ncbi:MAG TPA: leucyl/phenylalanyl-tRNA--protein transferase [Thermodesulfobacteriota bacterium]|nr:leucyl/phenylalanyl-tRNA--protein transferase [Thermodesulfobacteriota bacterium]
MPVYLLDSSISFPGPDMAEEDGLLAIGGDLSKERLLLAYASGIFPWYSEGYPIMWFSPDPRLIFELGGLHVSKSLMKTIKSGVFEVRFDTAFEEVMRLCAATARKGQEGTWITGDMLDAYTRLHHDGYAHSVETYRGDELVGGLYGVSLGGVFFGESMFHRVRDASKVAFYHLDRFLASNGFDFIDSQVPNSHMKSLGGKEISREEFLSRLAKSLEKKTLRGRWRYEPET